MARAAAEVGSTANSYQILAKLAAGGMAEIFLARGEGVAGVERYCVLKRILRERASDVQFVRMFLDEARLAAQLQHPNIAQVYDIGKLGDSYFFTMEYVHGETVRALLHRALGLRRRLPINCVLTIIAGAAAGLHHAHVRVGVDGRALGIVHRDVSPSNLMVSYEGGVKLVDFGVAKAADRAHETKSGTVKGKISYLSPEQCRGKRVDRRSDLFSLGICFWEMLTTERLYRRASDFENMNAIVSEPPPAPSSRRADVPPEIDELVLRLLAKDADDRCQTADQVVEEVEAVAARTSSVLSGSVLGRFVRELFGQRPEPWLELEALQEQPEAVTVTSEPIPRELAVPPADRIDHQLSSVLDLSAPRAATESIDALQDSLQDPLQIGAVPGHRSSEPTAQLGKPAKRGFPLAAPPPTSPGIAQPPPAGPVVAPPPPPPVRQSGPSPVVAAPPLVAAPRGADDFSSSAIALPAPPEGPPAVPPSGPAAAFASQGTSGSGRSAAFASQGTSAPGASASFAAQAAAAAASSGAFAASSESVAARAAAAGRRSGPRRAAWPLLAVIGGAALIGSIAMIIAMQSGGDPAVVGRATGPAIAAAVSPAGPEHRSAPIVEPIEPEARAPAGDADAAPGSAAGSAAAPAASPPRAGSASKSAAPARTVPRGSAALHGADRREPAEDISRLYGDGHYDRVLARCSDAPVSAEHTPLCFLAACHLGDDAAARRLVGTVPAARRDQLTTNCKQLGVDLKKAECEADPMACQH
ncbi:MAG TPA: serine/threonine-protein kinase [Kofleriaceae bacterium]|nr:serine/threonine-protein kinase [Kofleriaceae bacterium]